MNIWEADKLVIFIAFVIPGFIMLKVYELLNPSQIRDSSKQIIDAVTYSSINYTLLLLPFYFLEISQLKNNSLILYIFIFCSLFISPILIALFWNWLRQRDFIQKKIPHPIQKPWDWFFSQKNSLWVKITMKNGDVIGGLYAENSFSSNAPSDEQIYLEESWKIDKEGRFTKAKNDTAGVIVSMSEVNFMEFRKRGD